MGGQDKQGFPMKQGVLTPNRVRVLMSPGQQCFLGHNRRNGERRRKTVRGCVVSQDLATLNLIIVKQVRFFVYVCVFSISQSFLLIRCFLFFFKKKQDDN